MRAPLNLLSYLLLSLASLLAAKASQADYVPGILEPETSKISKSASHIDPTTIRWQSAQFKSREDLKASWHSNFSGAVQFPDPYVDPESLIQFKNPGCHDQVKAASRILDAYTYNAVNSANALLADNQQALDDSLSDAEKSGCFEDVSRLIAVRSLTFLATDDRFDSCVGSLSHCELDGAFIGPNKSHDPSLSEGGTNRAHFSFVLSDHWILNLIAISLINHGHVAFMTPEQRLALHFDPEILGAYDCTQGTIYLDPSLPPLDLAAIFAHEIEHVLRDKLLDATQMHLSAKQFLLLDESLASIYAGFLQRNLSAYHFDKSAGKLASDALYDFSHLWIAGMLRNTHNNYSVSSDISFFSRNGALNSLWEGLGFHPEDDAIHSLSSWSDFEDMTFLRSDGSSLNAKASELIAGYGADEIDSKTRTLYNVVKNIYFNEPLNDADRKLLSPSSLGLELDPLTRALRSVPLLFTSELHSEDPLDFRSKYSTLQYWRTWKTPILSNGLGQLVSDGSGRPYESRLKTMDIRFRIDALLEFLDQLEAKFSAQPSSVCKMIDDAAKNGELEDYAGFKHGHERVRPGGEGVRPGSKGIKPGLTLRACMPIRRKL